MPNFALRIIAHMKVLRTRRQVQDFSREVRENGGTLGLVPTMGALHNGHISLVTKALQGNDATLVSVFVNPTQFNNPSDLATYPRKEEADFELLRKAGATAVFAPSVEEIYPSGADAGTHVFDLGEVAEVMEGAMRPGHFQGVAQIVSLLLRTASPTRAYFGEKDFQQIAVIRRMVQTEGIETEIVACPIVRESDGLALSSRNVRLTPAQRKVAPSIHRILVESLEWVKSCSPEQVHDMVVEKIDALPECRTEYFSIVDGLTLRDVRSWEDAAHIVGCITVYVGDVRLIDNICYRR